VLPYSWSEDTFIDAFFSNILFEKNDKRFIEFATQVLERDHYTCVGCGFKSSPGKAVSGYMQVMAADGNYRNFSVSNFQAVCPFCHSYKNLKYSIISGRFIPILSNAKPSEISLLCLSLFPALTNKADDDYETAKRLYDELYSLSAQVSHLIPKQISTAQYHSRDEVLKVFLNNIVFLAGKPDNQQFKLATQFIRLLPVYDRFADESEHWYRQLAHME